MAKEMSDLEMVKRCARAMKLGVVKELPTGSIGPRGKHFTAFGIHNNGKDGNWSRYNPLTDDAQAMALIKRYRLVVRPLEQGIWAAVYGRAWKEHTNLNRAVVLCVAAQPVSAIAAEEEKR